MRTSLSLLATTLLLTAGGGPVARGQAVQPAPLDPSTPPTPAPSAASASAATPPPTVADVDAPLDPKEPLRTRAATNQADPEEILSPSFAGADAQVSGTAGPADAQRVLGETVTGAPEPGADLFFLPGLVGPIGLLRVSTADTAASGHLRLGLHGEYFSGDDVLVTRDHNQRLQGTLTLGYTPIAHLDLFGAFLGSSNRNQRVCDSGGCQSEPGRSDPELIRAFGDVILGAKYARPLGRGLSGGGEIYVRMLSAISGLSLDPGATSLSLRALGSVDFRALANAPVRTHLNLGYYVDNSDSLQNYAGIGEASKLVSSFAYGIGRSRLRAALAVDVPLPPVARNVFLLPFAEYHVEVVTGDRDPTFEAYAPPLCGTEGGKACIDNRDQQWLTLGARALLGAGFSIDLAVDLAVRSVGFPYGAPLPPYNIILGGTLPIDLGNWGKTRVVTRTVTVEKTVATAAAAPPEGVFTGSVVSASGGVAVPGAIVAVMGRAQARVASDPDGAFTSHPLPPGEVDLEIAAAGFEPQTVRVEIAAGMSTELRVALVPKAVTVTVSGRLTDGKGGAVAGTVRLVGATSTTTQAGDDGRFSAVVEPGPYVVHAEASRHMSKEIRLTVREGGPAQVDFSLRRRPTTPAVKVVGAGLVAVRRVQFRVLGDKPTDQLTIASQSVLDEIVDLLVRNVNITRLDIETHWDSGIGRTPAMDVTTRQANAIADYLREQGVAADRIRAVPKGATQPRVPNIGLKNRRKNQRVKFRLVRA